MRAGLSASGNGAIWAMTTFLESISMVWKLMRGAGAMAVRAMLAILDSREAMSETPTTVRSTDPSSTRKITVSPSGVLAKAHSVSGIWGTPPAARWVTDCVA